jgi:hypothetical protein
MALLLGKAPTGAKESQMHNGTTIVHLVGKLKRCDITYRAAD